MTYDFEKKSMGLRYWSVIKQTVDENDEKITTITIPDFPSARIVNKELVVAIQSAILWLKKSVADLIAADKNPPKPTPKEMIQHDENDTLRELPVQVEIPSQLYDDDDNQKNNDDAEDEDENDANATCPQFKKELATRQLVIRIGDSEYADLHKKALEMGVPKATLVKMWVRQNLKN
jgi:hypothetical protein